MKQIILLLICLTTWINNVQAEGIWSVNGYHLSNVNILHKSNTVYVSGRIQGGLGADYLKIRILVSNDNGYRGWAETSVQHYAGKGELFESQFKYYPKARLWNIEKIEVIGNNITGAQNSQNSRMSLCRVTSTVDLLIKVYAPGQGIQTFNVGPGRPYILSIASGAYRAEISAGKGSKFQDVTFPSGECTWNFQ